MWHWDQKRAGVVLLFYHVGLRESVRGGLAASALIHWAIKLANGVFPTCYIVNRVYTKARDLLFCFVFLLFNLNLKLALLVYSKYFLSICSTIYLNILADLVICDVSLSILKSQNIRNMLAFLNTFIQQVSKGHICFGH